MFLSFVLWESISYSSSLSYVKDAMTLTNSFSVAMLALSVALSVTEAYHGCCFLMFLSFDFALMWLSEVASWYANEAVCQSS